MARRRANNEGSIYQRGDGRWVAAISIDGKRVSKYGKTQAEVRTWLKEKVAQVDQGLTYDATKITVKEYLEDWLVATRPSIAYKTYRQYEAKCRLHIIPYLRGIKLSELRPDQIQAMYNRELAKTSEYNVEMMHIVLRRALKIAVKQGLIIRNPTDGVSQPHRPSKEFTTLTENQVRSLLSVVKGDLYEALYYLAIETGIRQGALLGHHSQVKHINKLSR